MHEILAVEKKSEGKVYQTKIKKWNKGGIFSRIYASCVVVFKAFSETDRWQIKPPEK